MRVVVFGGVCVPLNLAGCVEVVWTMTEGFLSEQCLMLFQCPLFGFKRIWIWCRGLGHGARNGGGWCFEFSEESAVSQGDST